MPHKLTFRVLHVSGQEESNKAAELNNHVPGSRGWHSARFCLYPQDCVLYLENRCQLKKIQILSHQHLIASKIEFYIGDFPESVPNTLANVHYTRLGYVVLSDNEKTQFKARELKSVHVDAVGLYLKMVIHKNYINKYNLYNQVGIVAINLIGSELHSDIDVNVDDTRPDYISPLDDLAFDISQDPEIAAIIRKLERKKQDAVAAENFDAAKKIRDAIVYLQQVGEKLGKLEIEKRQAIEQENYERAKLKKNQLEEYRNSVYKELDVRALLDGQFYYKPQDYAIPIKRGEIPQ